MKKRILSIVLVLVMLVAAVSIPVSAAPSKNPEILGASIRTEGTQGLRFVGRISKSCGVALTAGGNNVNFGILLIPESMLAAGTNITVNTPNVKNVPAKILMGYATVSAVGLAYDDSYYYFSAVQTGIPAEFYGTNLLARAYVKEGSNYYYSTQEKRSVQYVAQKVVDAGGSIPAAITKALADYEEVGSDILVNSEAFATLVTYPAYPSIIATDSLYTVSVKQGSNTQNLTVYNETDDYSHFSKDSSSSRVLGANDGNRRFCEFAFQWAKVTVNIRVNKSFSTYTVSPSSKNFETSYANGVISVTLDQPEYFVLILDNDYNTALSVFADEPETVVPSKSDTNVVYVEGNSVITDAGNHVTYRGSNNEVMCISDNYTKVYIAPGAVLTKRIVFNRADEDRQAYDCTIFGRGAILDPYTEYLQTSNQNSLPTYTDWIGGSSTKTYKANATVIFHGYSCQMEDVKVLNSAHFNVKYLQSTGYANHVKLLSTQMSTDGFTTTGARGSKDDEGVIENCFVYVGDNALVMQNDSEATAGYLFRNIIVGTTCAAIYPQYYAKSTLEDIYVFRADDGLINVYEDGVGGMTMNINNLDALDCVKTPTIFSDNGGTGTATKTFNLNNVTTRYTTGSVSSFTAGTYSSQYNALDCSSSGYTLNFTNLYVGGHRIGPDNDGSSIKVGSYYLGANSTGGTTVSGMTVNFDYNASNKPAHTSIPTAKTANYTYTGSAVYGPTRDWTRYSSYKCVIHKGSASSYTATYTENADSTAWGISKDITNYVRQKGTGSYSFSFTTNASVTVYVVKCSATNGTTSTLVNKSYSSGSRSCTFSITDLTAEYQIVIKSNSSSDNASFTITNPSVSKS